MSEEIFVSEERYVELLRNEMELNAMQNGGISNYEFYDECKRLSNLTGDNEDLYTDIEDLTDEEVLGFYDLA